MKRLTTHARATIGQRVQITWTISRGRDTGGYPVASLRDDRGRLRARCSGGGFDMEGTVLGNWIADEFRAELLKLREADMPARRRWQPEAARYCAGECRKAWKTNAALIAGEPQIANLPALAEDCFECPTCKGPTNASREGKRIDDGRSFYGLRFYDPDYDPGKAIVGRDCADRTFGKEGENFGLTVTEAEAKGQSFGLERMQAFYAQTSPCPTRRHRIPTIDGACGTSSVLEILRAIGLELEHVTDRKNLDVYVIRRHVSRR